MKFPVTYQQSPSPKSVSCNNTARNTGLFHTPNLSYEPTSVLDLRRSPSPAIDLPVSGTEISATSDVVSLSQSNDLEWDERMLHNLDDWESIMHDFGLHDDSAATFRTIPQIDLQIPELPPTINSQPLDHSPFLPSEFDLTDTTLSQNSFDLTNWNVNVGFDFVDELVRAAGCFDSNELQLAQVILARLNQRLRSPVGKPLQRAAFYFKEALQSLLTGSNRTVRSSSSEIVQTIKAYKTFSGISPIPMFVNFTANQAVLEAVSESVFIHIIDFDIGLGGQYASLMKEIADRDGPSVLRVTAVVPEEYAIETRLIRDNLCQFAEELKIRFHMEFVLIRTFEMLSFKAIKFIDGERTAVHLSPTIFRRVGSGFVNDLRRISPNVVVFVDGEGCTDAGGSTSSFRRSFVEGLEFYSVMFDSLDGAVGGAGNDYVRRIEMFLMRPRIFAAVESAAGRRTTVSWREVLIGAGMRPVVLSQFADFQAECLLRKAQVRGFHVAKRHGELVLCWHGRALIATSAWRW